MSTAKIKSVRLAAAHEGVAEMILDIEFENGGTSEVCLDHSSSIALMEDCKASSAEELVGHSWEKVRDALTQAYNRY
jgi:hypothetical protein